MNNFRYYLKRIVLMSIITILVVGVLYVLYASPIAYFGVVFSVISLIVLLLHINYLLADIVITEYETYKNGRK